MAFPSGTNLMIWHYAGATGPWARARASANRQHPYETLEVNCELPLAVGDRVALCFYHEQGSAYTPRLMGGDSNLDPYTPSMSCWRISY